MSTLPWNDYLESYDDGFSDYAFWCDGNSYEEPEPNFEIHGLDEARARAEDPAARHLQSEVESRTIIVSNLMNDLMSDDRLGTMVGATFGPIKEIKLSPAHRLCMIVFFDLRHARAMRMCDIRYRGYALDVSFGPSEPVTDPRKPPNNGTAVIFHLKEKVSDEAIWREFGKYGKIRQVRQTPQKTAHRFVEYWDTRDAETAVHRANGAYVFGSRIAVEFGLPTRFSREPERPPVVSASPTIQRRKPRPCVAFDFGRSV